MQEFKCVVLADRHHELSEGIRGLLETEFSSVVMVTNETSLIEGSVRLAPELVVADLALTKRDGFGWLSRLIERCPGLRVIVLSSHEEEIIIDGAFAAGAAGYVRRRRIGSELLEAIRCVAAGGQYRGASATVSGTPQPEHPETP